MEVKDSSPVLAVIFKVAEKAGLKMEDCYALFEMSETLRLGKCNVIILLCMI